MVKKTNKTDRLVSAKETQLEALEKLQKLEEKVTLLSERYESAEEKYRRALADYQNQERRQKEKESQIIKMANASLIEKTLFILDSLKLAQSHLQDKGLTMILDQFVKILESEGLKKIETENLPFDPISMDCSEIVPGEKDLVIETVLDGYTLFEKVLRPAKVKVGNGDPVIASFGTPNRGNPENNK